MSSESSMGRGLNQWLLSYLFQTGSRVFFNKKQTLKHILLTVVDHFEPSNGGVDFDVATSRVKTFVRKYREMGRLHVDSDGRFPQHTWFYPPHHNHVFLKDLVDICKEGFGEIEMHLHHNHMKPFPEKQGSLKKKIMQCIDDYSRLGIFCLPDGRRQFAFIHGDWSLDNSRGSSFCGVNDEIQILKECGCFADFTFPSLGVSQPSMINKFFYVKDNPHKPKSYNRGKELVVMGKEWGDLLLIQGIIGLRWKSRTHKFKPSIEASNLDENDLPLPGRVDYWVNNGIRISGRPDWIFIKLHTHGAREKSWDALLGERASEMFSCFESRYNDGERYQLHYLTAREMFNIAKAAECGYTGNPNKYRDFLIPQYVYVNKG